MIQETSFSLKENGEIMSNDKKFYLEYIVDGNDFTNCGSVTEDVKRTLKGMDYSAEVVRKITVAMYEAEINMAIHGGGGSVGVEVGSTKITVHLVDTGKGIADIDLAMQEGYSTASPEIKKLGFGEGMGLPKMKKYSDNLVIESKVNKGTSVRMEFML